MARALRRVSVERGIDPRSCVLVAFGGGGPLHACGLADRLGMTRVLVPPHAGVLSALGLAVAPERRTAIGSVMAQLDDMTADTLGVRVPSTLPHAPAARLTWLTLPACDTRDRDTSSRSPFDTGMTSAALGQRFATLHVRRYGFELPLPRGSGVGAIGAVGGHPHRSRCRARVEAHGAPARASMTAACLTRRYEGAASIALPDATMLVPEGWTAMALPIGGWIMDQRLSPSPSPEFRRSHDVSDSRSRITIHRVRFPIPDSRRCSIPCRSP